MHTPINPPPPLPDQSEREGARWKDLVSALNSKLPLMQDQFVRRVQEIPEYSSQTISSEDLRSAAAASIELILGALGSRDQYPQLLEFARNLGDKRARQGLPAEALISAVRLDFPIVWTTLLEISSPADAPVLVTRAEEVWRVVDDYAAATHSSYLAARVSMAQEEAGVRQEFISALFGAHGRLPEIRERFAKAFGVNPSAPYGIVAAQGEAANRIRRLAARPNQSSRFFLHQAEDTTYAFWPVSHATQTTAAVSVPRDLADINCGVADASDGLVELAAAGRIAAALSELSIDADNGALTVDTGWPRLARARMESIGVNLAGALEQELSADCRPDEIARLRETVLCFAANGSVNATAAQLFCHRNTILNRLRRFREVTNVDLMVPIQAARAVVAWA